MILTNGRIYTMEPRPTPECFDQAVSEAIDECLAAGLTGIHEMGVELHAVESYRRLVERGQFPFRNYAAAAARSRSTWAHYREYGPETIGDGRVAVRALKLMADGALGSRGAALHDAYCDGPGNTGLVLIPAEESRGSRSRRPRAASRSASTRSAIARTR